MSAVLTPYRRFPGTARAAMEFYRSLFGGQLRITPFSAVHSPGEVGEMGDQVMHAELAVAGRVLLFASDIPPGMDTVKGQDTPLALTGDGGQEGQLRAWWEQLSAGGQVAMPLQEVPWGGFYGALEDRFGTHWVCHIS